MITTHTCPHRNAALPNLPPAAFARRSRHVRLCLPAGARGVGLPLPLHALIDLDEPEPFEEFDDDDIDDEDDERNLLTDVIGSK